MKKMLVKWFGNFKSMQRVASLLLVPAMLFVSCGDDNPDPVKVAVSFLDAVNNPNVKAIEMTETSFKFGIAASGNADGNIDATIEADFSLVSSFNTINKSEYLPMVDGGYVLSGNEFAISDGKMKSDSLLLTIKPEGKLEIGKSYLLPIKIKEINGNGTISETAGVIYFVITINKPKDVVLKDIDRSAWDIECSSQELKGEGAGNGNVVYVLDNNKSSFWHSQYLPTATDYPHWILIDMKQECSIRAFWIVHCQQDWAVSKPVKMYFEVSSDKANWTRVADAVATASLDKQTFQLGKDVKGAYFRVTFETSASNEKYCYLGELGASYNSAE